jgi:hypothetical protein
MNNAQKEWHKAVRDHCSVPAWMGYLLYRFRVPLDWKVLNASSPNL